MLAGLFALLIAAGAIAAGVGQIRIARRMRFFQKTRGRILTREVYDDINFSNQEGKWGKGGGYTPRYTYSYEVGGVPYTGTKFTYTVRGYKKSIVQQMIDAMPDDVDVYYDPDDPGEAYLALEKSPTIGWVLIGTGVVIALFGLAFVVGS
jgi:hypothetical protein